MTMIHFVNCAVLTFAPYWVLYKSSKLSEYRALQVILFAGLGFALTQVAELISMALLLPGKTDAPGFHLGQELGELLVHFLEPIGVHLTLNKIPRLSQYPADLRVVAVAIGWSCAQSLALFLFPLWFGARGMEFSWDYIQMGLTANVQLLFHLAFLASVWLWARRDLEISTKGSRPLVGAIIFSHVAFPTLARYLEHSAGLSKWSILAGYFGLALVSALAVRGLLYKFQRSSSQ